jgi:hypothetical protein
MVAEDDRQNSRGVLQDLVWGHSCLSLLWIFNVLFDAFRLLQLEQVVTEDVGLLKEVLLTGVVFQGLLFLIGNWDRGQLLGVFIGLEGIFKSFLYNILDFDRLIF